MLCHIQGKILKKSDAFAVVEVGSVGLKVFAAKRTLASLPSAGGKVALSTHLHVREDALELYGFSDDADLAFFELLISVSGVGPKSALAIMDIAKRDELAAAIKEGRPDLLTKASGIGRKTAERIIVELRNRVAAPASGDTIKKMESDTELVEILVGLGYRKEDVRRMLGKISSGSLEEQIKQALHLLGGASRA